MWIIGSPSTDELGRLPWQARNAAHKDRKRGTVALYTSGAECFDIWCVAYND